MTGATSTPNDATHAEDREKSASASRPSLNIVSWVWLLPAVFIALMAWNQRWMSDDGWINIRVVEQVLAGNGPVFNTGQRVEVGTSTLWLWLLIAVSALIPVFEPSQLAMVLGTGLTTAALVFASLGSMHLLAPGPSAGRPILWVPAGTAVLAALPPVWDFATSGLEMSLAFCWLAVCFWGLARRVVRMRAPGAAAQASAAFRPWWLPVLIGLGPLVRPDFALFTVAFAVALLIQSRRSLVSGLIAALLALAIPGAYQIFRMGYYAALVPNTALAKDASGARWDEGLAYLFDFVQPYAVWLPVILVVVAQMFLVRRWIAARDAARVVLTLALPVAGVLHAAYFVRVGGDFMHARFLLPATMAVLLPVSVYPLRRPANRLAIVFVTALVLWALTVAAGPRTRYGDIKMEGQFSGRPVQSGLANERGWWVSRTGSHETVKIEDWIWAGSDAEDSMLARWDLERDRSYYAEDVLEPDDLESDTRGGAIQDYIRTDNGVLERTAPGVSIAVQNIGATGVLAGNGVHVVDMVGLSDAVSARVRYDPMFIGPARNGHDVKPVYWRLAQYAAPTADESPDLQRARTVLACRPVRNLVRATTADLTPRLFLSNVRHSVTYTRLTIPADPLIAQGKLCQ